MGHTRRAFRPAFAAAGLALMAAAGCAGNPLQGLVNPDVQLSQIVVRGFGISGGTLDLVVAVHNPNNVALQGTRVELGFDVEGKHVGDVRSDDAFALPENGTTTVTLPVRFTWAGVGSAVRSALDYGDIPYTMKGQVTLAMPGGRGLVVPFTREGRMPLTRAANGASVAAPVKP